MVLRYFTVFAGLFLITSCGGEAPVVENEDPKIEEPMGTEEARTVYTLNCASCHGQDGKLKASSAADLSESEMDDAHIKQTILNGNDKGMMPYKEMLSAREVEGLVKFVKTLREE